MVSQTVRPRDPAYARFASSGGFKSAEARSAKAESGDPERQIPPSKIGPWVPAFAGTNGVCWSLTPSHTLHTEFRIIGKPGAHMRALCATRLRGIAVMPGEAIESKLQDDLA